MERRNRGTGRQDDDGRFEILVSDLAAEFVHMPAEQVDAAIQGAQRRLVETLDLDRSTLGQFVDAPRPSPDALLDPAGVSALPGGLQTGRHSAVVASAVDASKAVCLASLHEVPADQPDPDGALAFIGSPDNKGRAVSWSRVRSPTRQCGIS